MAEQSYNLKYTGKEIDDLLDKANDMNGSAQVPTGGTSGQVLTKKSGTDFDAEWKTPGVALPAGGTAGQILTKNSSTNGDASWKTPKAPSNPLPVGGTTGQVLAKKSNTNYDAEWIDARPYVPIGGIIEWDGTGLTGAPDLSTPEKVADVYGYGTWERYGVDRVTLGAGGEYTAGSIGGEASHTLTVTELPKDIGKFDALTWASNNNLTSGAFTVYQRHKDKNLNGGDIVGDALFTLSGGGSAHNNMPPYTTVYRYRRIA